MTQGSSLPPLKKRDGKYGLIALLFVLAALGLWLFWASDEPAAPDEIAEPAPEPAPAPREQFVAEIEIPDDVPGDTGDTGGGGQVEQERSAQPTGAGWTPPEEWECLGTLQASEIRNVINGQPRKQVQTCYEHRLKDNNLLQGSMKVLLTIGANGDVRAVSIEGSLNDPQVYSCVRRVAKTWKFPKPQGGCVRTEVPFQMTPKL